MNCIKLRVHFTCYKPGEHPDDAPKYVGDAKWDGQSVQPAVGDTLDLGVRMLADPDAFMLETWACRVLNRHIGRDFIGCDVVMLEHVGSESSRWNE